VIIDPKTYGESIEETWVDRDGRAWSREVTSDGSASSELMEWDVGANPRFASPLTYEEVLALPRDPKLLYDQVTETAGPSRNPSSYGQFFAFGNILRQPIPIDLQAALLEAVALVPKTTLVGDIQTPHGGPATAISLELRPGIANELLLDPDTGEYLGQTLVLGGKRYYEALVLERAVVDSVGQAP
jgi:hypothetical protein